MSQAFHGGRLMEAATEFGLAPGDFVDFSANLNPFAPEISAGQWEKWRCATVRYPEADANGVRDRLADTYGVSAQRVVPAAGAIEALYLAARLVANCKVGVIEPAFGDYARAFEAAGCTPVRVLLPREAWHVPITDWVHLLEPFDVIVLGNPNNPTGSLQLRAYLLQAMAMLGKRTWIVDEAFIEFAAEFEAATLLPKLEDHPSLIVLRSLTKTWCIPGLRLGFLATANADWLADSRRMQPPWSVNTLAQSWVDSFLTFENQARLTASFAELRRLRSAFAESLAAIAGLRIHPSVANFLLVELIEASLDATLIYRALARRGLLVRVCDSFHGMPAGRFIRVAVRTAAQNVQLAQALAAVCDELIRKAA